MKIKIPFIGPILNTYLDWVKSFRGKFNLILTRHDKLSPARLAQSVEHQTFNLRVMGSSPISGGTSTFFFLAQSSLLAQGMIAAGFRRAKTT